MATYPRCVVRLDLLMEEWGSSASVQRTIAVIPRDCEITRNDARHADAARFTLDFHDFPMDPRTVRSARVSILLGDVGSPAGQLDDEDLAFAGYMDTPKVHRSEEGATVTVECSDYTSTLLDYRWADGLIDVTAPLQDVVQGIVDKIAALEGVTIGFSEGLSNLVLSTITGRTRFAPRKNDDAWTVLTDLCALVGAVPVFELDLLLILSPDDFGVDRATFLRSDTLAPNTAAFVYGEADGAESLSIQRKFRSAARRQIRVLCWDETARKVTEATYPASPVVVSKTITKAGKVRESAAPVLTFNTAGVYAAAELSDMARRLYNEVSREEVEVEFATHRIAPTLANGARVTITVSPTLSTDIAGLSAGEALQLLTSGPRPMASDVAEALVAGAAKADSLAREFYCRSATHRWSREGGYTLDAVLINILGGQT